MKIFIEYKTEKEKIVKRAKAMTTRVKAFRNLKRVALFLIVPAFVFSFFLFCSKISMGETFLPIWIIFFLVYAGMFWYCIWGAKVVFIKQTEQKIKETLYPSVYTVEIDEHGIFLNSDNFSQKLNWEDITVAYEDDEYWYFGKFGIGVEKESLREENPEAYDFIDRKKEEICKKGEWI